MVILEVCGHSEVCVVILEVCGHSEVCVRSDQCPY